MTRSARGRRTRWALVGGTFAVVVPLVLVTVAVPHPVGAPRNVMAASVDPSASGPPLAAPIATIPDVLRPVPAEPQTAPAEAAVAAAEDAAAPSTQLAVAVLDRDTGELAVNQRGAEPFYTASLSKLVLAVDVLDRMRLDGLAVTDADIDLLRRALGPSDDSAMNALWSRFDGAGAAGRLRDRLGLAGTADPRDPSQWGEMTVPAADTVRIWQHILDEVPPAERELLIAAMGEAPTRAQDGFDQAFGLLDPEVDGPGAVGAVAKQGWMCCFAGTYYMHSTGAVGVDQRFLVALLTRVPRAPGWEASRAELDRIADAAVQALD